MSQRKKRPRAPYRGYHSLQYQRAKSWSLGGFFATLAVILILTSSFLAVSLARSVDRNGTSDLDVDMVANPSAPAKETKEELDEAQESAEHSVEKADELVQEVEELEKTIQYQQLADEYGPYLDKYKDYIKIFNYGAAGNNDHRLTPNEFHLELDDGGEWILQEPENIRVPLEAP